MACGLTYGRTATSTILVLLVLLEAALVLDRVSAAPVQQQRNDILAGTEFLSVFINGAMAPVPVAPPSPRRRGFRRGGSSPNNAHSTSDSATSESRQSEASIYRISRAPSSPRPLVTRPGNREEGARLYPINQKTLESGSTSLNSELGRTSEGHRHHLKSNGTESSGSLILLKSNRGSYRNVNQKVIGVSVTSTVEATPYKVRVEHHDPESKVNVVTRPPVGESTEAYVSSTSETDTTRTTSTGATPTTLATSTNSRVLTSTSTTTTVTPLPAQLVTEELSNIVSESNRSEFSVDEGLPKTSLRGRSSVTTGSMAARSSTPTSASFKGSDEPVRDSEETSTSLEPVEEVYELPEEDLEPREPNSHELGEQPLHQGRKAGRHYEATIYNQHAGKPRYPLEISKMYGKPDRAFEEPGKNGYGELNYGEPARVYSEPAKVYSEPSKVYSEPSKVYSEPAKVYGEPERVYGEPAKVYSEPARVYGEPAKVYSEPAKVYGEPSKTYGPDGRPLNRKAHNEEQPEENYEVDEAVSVGSNGNVHGPQLAVTEAAAPATTPTQVAKENNPDGHKVGYVVDERNYRKYRVEERTPDGFIVGEYGVVSHDDGSLRGVRYTADGTIDPRLIYEALMKFLAL